jgi:hypothetical protein
MRKQDEGAHWPVEKPNGPSEQLNDAPPWSPWNFLHKKHDWQEDIYDELPTSTSQGASKE